jgi:hypothetical protein
MRQPDRSGLLRARVQITQKIVAQTPIDTLIDACLSLLARGHRLRDIPPRL